jgi:transposase
MSPTTYLGIDVAARTLAVALLTDAPPPAVALPPVANTPAGWQILIATLSDQGGAPATTRIIMEATGAYWQGVATTLHQAGWAVSVVSPGSVRAFARARLRRAKTDRVDAALLADYGRAMQPAVWSPPPAAVTALQLLLRQRDDLVTLRTETRNRQHALAQLPLRPPAVEEPLAAVVRVVEEQIAALDAAIKQHATASASVAADIARLETIVGVGLLTAAVVVAETRPLWGNATPRQVVAYAGLDPAPHQSGTAVRGAGHISKTGNARLRQAVYMAAVTAARCNPVLKPFYERLLAGGKCKKVALVAVARKLLALMVTLLIHQRDFDPDWRVQRLPLS